MTLTYSKDLSATNWANVLSCWPGPFFNIYKYNNVFPISLSIGSDENSIKANVTTRDFVNYLKSF